jgi:hypothetical protein
VVRAWAGHESTLPLLLLRDGTPIPPEAFEGLQGQAAAAAAAGSLIVPPGARLAVRGGRKGTDTALAGLPPPLLLPPNSLAAWLQSIAAIVATLQSFLENSSEEGSGSGGSSGGSSSSSKPGLDVELLLGASW